MYVYYAFNDRKKNTGYLYNTTFVTRHILSYVWTYGIRGLTRTLNVKNCEEKKKKTEMKNDNNNNIISAAAVWQY